jgi:hypothetical protein
MIMGGKHSFFGLRHKLNQAPGAMMREAYCTQTDKKGSIRAQITTADATESSEEKRS